MSGKQTGKTLFECAYCHSHFLPDFVPPEKWIVRRYTVKSHFKFTCSNCGAFIYPVALLSGGKAPNEDIFFMFAGCVNAFRCYLHDQYSPSCEAPMLTPKCLFVIHGEIADANLRLEELEKRLPGKRPKKPASAADKKPDIKLSPRKLDPADPSYGKFVP